MLPRSVLGCVNPIVGMPSAARAIYCRHQGSPRTHPLVPDDAYMASPTVLRDALDLAPGDKKGELTLSLYPSLGCVLTFHATDLIFNLIQSLPRSLLSQVHEELTQVLRRDIIGDLPRELAVLIFVRLDTKSLLACGAVSRAWYAAANDQCELLLLHS